MKKIFTLMAFWLINSLILFCFIPAMAKADGFVVIKPDPYSDRWDYSNEESQQAFINYFNGVQKMIISIGLEEKNVNKAVWIFPVPSEPDKVAIDVVTDFPKLNGEDISKRGKAALKDARNLMQATQIYMIPNYLANNTYVGSSVIQGGNFIMGAVEVNPAQDVIVYEHLEKEGITSEILTARTVNGLNDYFKEKGLNIKSEAIPVLDNYIGKDYSFIASWLTQADLPSEESILKDNATITQETIQKDELQDSGAIKLTKEEIYSEIKGYIDNLESMPRKLEDEITILQYYYPDFPHIYSMYIAYLESHPEIKDILLTDIQSDPSIMDKEMRILQSLPADTVLTKEQAIAKIKYSFLTYKSQDNFSTIRGKIEKEFPEFPKAYNMHEQYRYLESHPEVLDEFVKEIQADPTAISEYVRPEDVRPDDAKDKLENDIASIATYPIKGENEDLSNEKGIYVTFPADKIYYPLAPTSVYGSNIIPITIRIMGFVPSKVFDDIKGYTTTKYYFDSYFGYSDELKVFFPENINEAKYTKIQINALSKLFTDDLWINPQTPAKVNLIFFIYQHIDIISIIIFVLACLLTGLLAGLIVFKELRNKPIKLALLGLFNCLSLLGVIVMLIFVGTKNKNASVESLLTTMKAKKYFWKRRIAVLLTIIAVLILIPAIIYLPEHISDIKNMVKYHRYSYLIEYATITVLLYLLPLIFLPTAFMLKKIKHEDQKLFDKLKSYGYSRWTFQLKDKIKIAYVPIFSVIFLIITWLLVGLVRLAI